MNETPINLSEDVVPIDGEGDSTSDISDFVSTGRSLTDLAGAGVSEFLREETEFNPQEHVIR
jgi:hypothetical protein